MRMDEQKSPYLYILYTITSMCKIHCSTLLTISAHPGKSDLIQFANMDSTCEVALTDIFCPRKSNVC